MMQIMRVEHVVHHHAPAGDVAEGGVDLLADVGEGGPGAGIGARHAAVADGGEQHGHHGDQDGGDDVAAAAIAEHAEDGHRRRGLDDDDAVEDQVPETERTAKLTLLAGRSGHGRCMGRSLAHGVLFGVGRWNRARRWRTKRMYRRDRSSCASSSRWRCRK